jgi:peptidoglycan-associated lipoprotein
MRRALFFLLPLGLTAGAASAQVRVPLLAPRQPPAPVLTGIDALRADFLARAGTDTLYFGNVSAQLGAPARAVLQAQALWLLQHPEVVVRIEGHADASDTRDHALAMGAKRAEEVRAALVLLGVPVAQLTTMSWGKERPGPPRSVTVLVR